MVIGERFAWAHLPKTGGMATERFFRIFEELILFSDPAHTNAMHTTFSAREAQVHGKVLAMNLRRLPAWVLSRAQHAARWGVWPDYKPIAMDSPQQLSESSFPDSRILIYTANGRFQIGHWLRMEALAEDFLVFISRFAESSEQKRQLVLEMRPVNAQEYAHEISSWFSTRQLMQMYERNPVWAELERRVYGDLLIPAESAG